MFCHLPAPKISFVKTTDGQIIEPKMSASFVPDHKASMVLFLDRVYGIENQDFLLHVLEVGFLPDMRAAASLDTVSRKRQKREIKQLIVISFLSTPQICMVDLSPSIALGTSSFSVFLADYRWHSVQLKWPWP